MKNPNHSSTLTAQQENHWIPLSDLMTGLMMVFLLIALTYMVKVEADTQKTKEIAILYEKLKTELYQDLEKEFKNDLPRWGAELQRDMAIRFKEPEVLFATGKDELKPRFKEILNDFFPRYLNILTSDKYKNSILEVRIEGHTSSIWSGKSTDQEAYFKNMELSQARTRTTLNYVMSIESSENRVKWLRHYVTANGLSSAKIISTKDGQEDIARSQRVEFRVKTDSESRIARIVEIAQR